MKKNRMTKLLAERRANGKHVNGSRNGHVAVLDAPRREATSAEVANALPPAPIPAVANDAKRTCEAVKLVLAAGGQPYCDPGGEFLIRRPQAAGKRRSRLSFPIRSPLMSAWLAKLHFDAELPAPNVRIQRQVTLILRGMALDNEEPAESHEFLEEHPVLYSVLRMVRASKDIGGTATELLNLFKDMGDFDRNDPRWPKDSTRLAGYLRQHAGTLAEMGIQYHYFRTDFKRIHGFRMINPDADTVAMHDADAVVEADTDTLPDSGPAMEPASDASQSLQNGYRHPDATDAPDAELCNRSPELAGGCIEDAPRGEATENTTANDPNRQRQAVAAPAAPSGNDFDSATCHPATSRSTRAAPGPNRPAAPQPAATRSVTGPVPPVPSQPPRRPDPYARMQDWYRDAEAFLNQQDVFDGPRPELGGIERPASDQSGPEPSGPDLASHVEPS